MTDERWVQTLLSLQRGVLTRAQALELLTTANGIHHRVRPGGPWHRLLPGVYLTSTGKPTFEQLMMAAQLYAGPRSLITGPAALSLHAVRVPKPTSVDVLVPPTQRPKSRGFVVIHRTRRLPTTFHQDLELRYVLGQRAVADAVRSLATIADARTVVGSAVQQKVCTVRSLTTELSQRHDPRDGLFRRVLAEVTDGIRSAPEGDLRELITGSSLAQPYYNPTLEVNGVFLAKPDAWWEEAGVAAEMDSQEFHFRPEDWRRTMARHRRMTAAGIAVLHISPGQLVEDPKGILADIASALRNGRPLPAIRTIASR